MRSRYRLAAQRAGVALALTVLAGVATVYAASERRLRRTYPVPAAPSLPVAADSATLARGAHLAATVSCTVCHGDDYGGKVYSASALLGTVAGPNLTRGRGGVGAALADSDWVRAIRHGVRRDGTSLIVMPSEVFTHLSDRDLGALVAYLRRLPPVDREVPRTGFGPMGRAMLAAGKLNILVAPKTPALAARAEVPPGPTAEYGRYLADISGCHGCHGYGLSGGRVAGPPGLPPASNLTPAGALRDWTEEQFARVLRTGVRPNGAPVDEFMPWRAYARMTDEDVRALWLYLRSVSPREFGNK